MIVFSVLPFLPKVFKAVSPFTCLDIFNWTNIGVFVLAHILFWSWSYSKSLTLVLVLVLVLVIVLVFAHVHCLALVVLQLLFNVVHLPVLLNVLHLLVWFLWFSGHLANLLYTAYVQFLNWGQTFGCVQCGNIIYYCRYSGCYPI